VLLLNDVEETESSDPAQNQRSHARFVSILNRYKFLLIGLFLVVAALIWGATIYANLSTRRIRYDLDRTSINAVPKKDVGIVFGAGLYDGNKPTPYLQWRVETAVRLYKAHRVSKLLMTGDNSRTSHDEPTAMQKLAVSLGVPSKDIVLDYAGYDTYDSCYRAHAIFKVKSAIIITQGYHLPRAVMACNDLGTPSIGVDAEHDKGRSWKAQYIVREWASTDKIVLQQLFKPKPAVLGPALPIK
jgi:vancomycin permeability regulator SanA